MKRFNSLPNCASLKATSRKRRMAISLPTLVFSCEECPSRSGATGLKRQNSRKVKLLQKTWEKVMTIIHPGGRRNSRPNKQSPSEIAESPRNYSPLVAKCSKSSQCSSSAPSTPIKKLVFDFEPIAPAGVGTDRKHGHHDHSYYQHHLEPGDPEVDQVVKNYVELQKRLSDELHYSMKDEKRKEEVLSEDFKKRLQQWEMWKASTGKFHYTEEELQKLIPLEFSKKLQEWEHMKNRPKEELRQSQGDAGGASGVAGHGAVGTVAKNERRKKKGGSDESHRLKELVWLEKQLEKIEGEKKRLEREMAKYCEREVRLQKMREALREVNPHQSKQIWIKTPTAECMVEGLNEKFTKKLYKWEEKKGIHPECSTMALLNPKYFTSEPEHYHHRHSLELEANQQPLLSDPDEEAQRSVSKEFSSASEEGSEVDEEYEEATDSFATKDEPASGTSNTDSDCFNLKPGFRRRSSDAISTPLSSARSPSPSCCTSDDEENFMLQTVAENDDDEKLVEEKPNPPIIRAKPILVDEGNAASAATVSEDTSGVIVKTQRTIFTPVDSESPSLDDQKVLILESPASSLSSPKLVKSISDKLFRAHDLQGQESSNKVTETYVRSNPEPPRIIEVIRKSSNASSTSIAFRLPPIPAPHKGQMIKDGSKPILGKIPVWCSPLMARRRFIASQNNTPLEIQEKFRPHTEFSLDKFLESNLIPIPPPRPSRIPVNNNSSPGCSRRKYSMVSGHGSGTSRDNNDSADGVRLVSLTRSSSFQGGAIGVELQHPVVVEERTEGQSQGQIGTIKTEILQASTSSVTKSKSTGSILGNVGTTRGIFGFASKFVPHKSSEPKQKKMKPGVLPSLGKTSANVNRK